MTQSSFVSFTELFAFMLNDGEASRGALVENFGDMLGVLGKAIDEVERGLMCIPHLASPNLNSRDKNSRNKGQVVLASLTTEDPPSPSPIKPGHRYMSQAERDGTHLRRTVMVTLQVRTHAAILKYFPTTKYLRIFF